MKKILWIALLCFLMLTIFSIFAYTRVSNLKVLSPANLIQFIHVEGGGINEIRKKPASSENFGPLRYGKFWIRLKPKKSRAFAIWIYHSNTLDYENLEIRSIEPNKLELRLYSNFKFIKRAIVDLNDVQAEYYLSVPK